MARTPGLSSSSRVFCASGIRSDAGICPPNICRSSVSVAGFLKFPESGSTAARAQIASFVTLITTPSGAPSTNRPFQCSRTPAIASLTTSWS